MVVDVILNFLIVEPLYLRPLIELLPGDRMDVNPDIPGLGILTEGLPTHTKEFTGLGDRVPFLRIYLYLTR